MPGIEDKVIIVVFRQHRCWRRRRRAHDERSCLNRERREAARGADTKRLRPSNIGDCNTASSPLEINPQTKPHSANLRRALCRMFW